MSTIKIIKTNWTRRAAVVAWTVITTSTMIGFAALAVDLGYVRVVQTQMQSAADASALAGASALLNPAALTGRMTQSELAADAIARAQAYAAKNSAENRSLILTPYDI